MRNKTLAVVGLGYVGLPLALAFSSILRTIGFDISANKISSYKAGEDPSGEMDAQAFAAAGELTFSCTPADLQQADYIMVAVPTPIHDDFKPDLTLLESACELVGSNLKPGAIVVFESTVYPGMTEEVCVPILTKISGLANDAAGFRVGYSPERVSPGDKTKTLRDIVKVVSGQDAATLDEVAALYETIIDAGIHRAASIKVAEAAKVIENTQRDLNIAFVNELSIIFDKMGIDTSDVLTAAGTKWNFLPFKPGLVGGHCISVDPYYLTHKSTVLGYHPDVILSGRAINNSMPTFIANKTLQLLSANGVSPSSSRVGVLGITFKEDCQDIRNSKVADLIAELRFVGVDLLVHDPIADAAEVKHEYNIELTSLDQFTNLDALIVAVPHRAYTGFDIDFFSRVKREQGLLQIVDLKGIYDREQLHQAGFNVWRL